MISISITDGPTVTVPWASGMNVENALQWAYSNQPDTVLYATQYFGPIMGNLIIMINETYESFPASAKYVPFYYWELLVNGVPASKGIDNTFLQDDDVITFSFIPYTESHAAESTVHAKHRYKTQAQ